MLSTFIKQSLFIQHKFSRFFFLYYYYFKICDLINDKLIRNGIVYYSSIIKIGQYGIFDHFGFLLSTMVLSNIHMYTAVSVGSAMITDIHHCNSA